MYNNCFLKTSDEQTLDWDLPANELIRVRPETDDEDEEDVVDASNENEPVCICIPEAQLMVQKLNPGFLKHLTIVDFSTSSQDFATQY
jgi:hypothetical protein